MRPRVAAALSVSSNGSTWVKPRATRRRAGVGQLSVSSNGSTWVKPITSLVALANRAAFSILERIDVGETKRGERVHTLSVTFSILERIDVGETKNRGWTLTGGRNLSVSSNGSTWVKLLYT